MPPKLQRRGLVFQRKWVTVTITVTVTVTFTVTVTVTVTVTDSYSDDGVSAVIGVQHTEVPNLGASWSRFLAVTLMMV